jgi:hypothetical protein
MQHTRQTGYEVRAGGGKGYKESSGKPLFHIRDRHRKRVREQKLRIAPTLSSPTPHYLNTATSRKLSQREE